MAKKTDSKQFDKAIEFDPACDRLNPVKVTFDDIAAATERIQDGIKRTTCERSHMSTQFGMEVYLKNEFLQITGSFKERGARNTLLQLSPKDKKAGVISASLGNHSQGLSYHGHLLNIPVTVVMPTVAPIMKIQKCQGYGANVIVHGLNMREAKYRALEIAKERGIIYVNGYDHPHIIAGQGSIGLEIIEQVPDLDAVLVPVGGAGLLAGVAAAIKHIKPHVLVYGIETNKCASMYEAFMKNEPSPITITSTLADGLAVATVGYNAYFTAKPITDKIIVVKEEWLARAILALVEKQKFVVEGGGAVGVAAIMAGLVPELAGKKVVCILTGGNIDTSLLGRVLDRGLAAEHRFVKFKVTISDRPGSLAELCRIMASIGVAVKDIMQERAWIFGDIFSVEVKVVCEIRGEEHLQELRQLICQNYTEYVFSEYNEEKKLGRNQCITAPAPSHSNR